MASQATNEAKRDLMSRVVTALFAKGWTAAQLAALMDVTPNTVHSWKRGDSMGTNFQRAELAKLSTPAELNIGEIIERYNQAVLRETLQLERDKTAGAELVAKTRLRRIKYYRDRAVLLRELFR